MKFSQDEIFYQQPQIVNDIQSQIQIVNAVQNENDYLSQFINSEGRGSVELSSNEASQSKQRPKSEIIQIRQSGSISAQCNSLDSSKNKKRERSYFHNFQKHLVNTLRKIIKFKKTLEKQYVPNIALLMWKKFLSSPQPSKKFLFVLFGVCEQGQENQFEKKFLQKLGLMEIFSKYSQNDIKQAQKYLRKQIINQFENCDLKNAILISKIERKIEFEKYVHQFLDELRQGRVKKRLPKEVKLQMISTCSNKSKTIR